MTPEPALYIDVSHYQVQLQLTFLSTIFTQVI